MATSNVSTLANGIRMICALGTSAHFWMGLETEMFHKMEPFKIASTPVGQFS